MYELEKSFTFEAGHVLKEHDGKCSGPHGHSYVITIKLRGNELAVSGPKKGMLMDFGDISKIAKPMIKEYFDHKWINDTLKTDFPTVEYIAKWIYEYLKPFLPLLYSIAVQETNTSRVTYIP